MKQLIAMSMDEQKTVFSLTVDIDGEQYQLTGQVKTYGEHSRIVFDDSELLFSLFVGENAGPIQLIGAAVRALYFDRSLDLPFVLEE